MERTEHTYLAEVTVEGTVQRSFNVRAPGPRTAGFVAYCEWTKMHRDAGAPAPRSA